MSHPGVLAWLEPRLAEVPESLAKRVREAVTDGSNRPEGTSLSDTLRSIAGELLCDAWSLPSTHDKAMILLTADALITYACEAVAISDPEALGDLR